MYLTEEVLSAGTQFPNEVPPGEQASGIYLLSPLLHGRGQQRHEEELESPVLSQQVQIEGEVVDEVFPGIVGSHLDQKQPVLEPLSVWIYIYSV